MYKCLTLTYHHPSTQYGVYTCPPSPYHMQIPLETCRCTWEHGGHTDVCGHSDIQEGNQTYGGIWMYGGVQTPPKSENPLPASKVGTSIVWCEICLLS